MRKLSKAILTGAAAVVIAGCAAGMTGFPAEVAQQPYLQPRQTQQLQNGNYIPAGFALFSPVTPVGSLTPAELSVQGRVAFPCMNEFCKRDSYDLAWEHYYDYPVSYRTRQLQYDRNQLEFGYLRRQFDLWEPQAISQR